MVEVGVADVAALERRVGEVVVEVGDKNFETLMRARGGGFQIADGC